MGQTLYELSGAYRAVQEAAEAGEDVGEALATLSDQLETKAAALVRLSREMDLDADKLGEEIGRLQARQKTLAANRERIKRYLKEGMEAAGIRSIKAGTFSLTVQPGPSRVDVLDQAKVPREYLRTKVEEAVDKRAVLAAYDQAGEVVPGTEVVATTCLRIR